MEWMSEFGAAAAVATLGTVFVAGVFKASNTAYLALTALLINTVIVLLAVSNTSALDILGLNPITTELLNFSVWSVLFLCVAIRIDFRRKVFFVAFWSTWTISFSVLLLDSDNSFLLPWVELPVLLATSFMLLYTLERLTKSQRLDTEAFVLLLMIAVLFIVDISRYTIAFVYEQENIGVLMRSFSYCFISILALIWLSIFDGTRTWNSRVKISQTAAYYGSIIFSTGLIVSLIIIFYSLINASNGFLVNALMSSTLFILSGLAIFSIMSIKFRSKARVFLNKNFFSHKYDYRSEWIKINKSLSEFDEGERFEEVALNSIIDVVSGEEGGLWLKEGANFRLAAHSNLFEFRKNISLYGAMLNRFYSDHWIFCPSASPGSKLAKFNHELPLELSKIKGLWLVIPLQIGNKVIGFAAIVNNKNEHLIDWEDLDIIRNVSGQIAGYLQLHIYEKREEIQAQLATYSQMSTFLVHDLNNVTAQLSMIVTNAAKYRTNPEFIDDTFETVENASQRLNTLTGRLNSGRAEAQELCTINDLITAVKSSTKKGFPEPEFAFEKRMAKRILCDKQKLSMAISHLIKNAQDASDALGKIFVEAKMEGPWAVFTIRDNGTGMSQKFIQTKLFKPFETTKKESGMGLGVFLTKQYVEQIGGALEVISEIGVGTEFVIQLPLVEEREEIVESKGL
ncbi:XrtA/PEP-CTERM system histidine kinase PrsK [Marinobacterium mangrovicola]|uniref:histidine kinase n=1 Tax=Marinobacterium mangrovicola TaxID=1476959 RepID=A0A4R1GKP7_9GAMM|nr:XrtA/PEP-CTERM system histidine kinase PrsK [Marinobacterium mangrovicola]TCK07525.1 putative PEP-CTERM system histidine kinase [Marinobacterium mangrovicola]